jgi:hypothetical protein
MEMMMLVFLVILLVPSGNGQAIQTNNSFCLDQGISALADGTQISNIVTCSTAIQGILPVADKMVSTIILSPNMNDKVNLNLLF